MKKTVIGREERGPFQSSRRFGRRGPPALVRRRPLVRHHILVSCEGRVLIAAMGAGGIAARKREGDGATPRARLQPTALLGKGPATGPLPFRRLRADDGWCDDVKSARYNAPVRLPFGAGHERLMRDDGIYDFILLTDHNRCPRVRGAGSAIFIHVARQAMTPTLGCLAFARAAWRHHIVPMGDYLVGVDPRPRRKR